jgi:hypothetical protein
VFEARRASRTKRKDDTGRMKTKEITGEWGEIKVEGG